MKINIFFGDQLLQIPRNFAPKILHTSNDSKFGQTSNAMEKKIKIISQSPLITETVFVLEFGEFVVTNIKLYSGMYLKLLIHSLL